MSIPPNKPYSHPKIITIINFSPSLSYKVTYAPARTSQLATPINAISYPITMPIQPSQHQKDYPRSQAQSSPASTHPIPSHHTHKLPAARQRATTRNRPPSRHTPSNFPTPPHRPETRFSQKSSQKVDHGRLKVPPVSYLGIKGDP